MGRQCPEILILFLQTSSTRPSHMISHQDTQKPSRLKKTISNISSVLAMAAGFLIKEINDRQPAGGSEVCGIGCESC